MKKGKFISYLIISLAILISSCSKKSGERQIPSIERPVPSDVCDIVADNTEFAINLYSQLKSAEGNLFFSPYGISTAMIMAYAGSRGNTEKQMGETLCLSLDSDNLHKELGSLQNRLNKVQESGNVELLIANSIWPQQEYKFLDEYTSLLENSYDVSITPVDFSNTPAVAEKINKWTEDKTESKITQIIDPGTLTALTRQVLVNVVYFKGQWEHRFPSQNTKELPFYVTPEQRIQVQMMIKEFKTWYADDDDLQIIELPYIGDNLSMIVILPREIDGLRQIEEKLSVENLSRWQAKMEMISTTIFLPKFTMTTKIDLNQHLIDMGMVDAFSEFNADFSGMTGNNNGLFISDVIHQAFVEVNEEGTEATAATIVKRSLGGGEEVFRFDANHPFLFLIWHKETHSILFMGRVYDPSV